MINQKKNKYSLFIEVNWFKTKEQVERFIAISVNDPEQKITEGTLH